MRNISVLRRFHICIPLLVLAVYWPAGAHVRENGYYRSVDGSRVHSPTHGNQDYGPVTARCSDGSRSFSHHAQGTCSHHGGVARWGSP